TLSPHEATSPASHDTRKDRSERRRDLGVRTSSAVARPVLPARRAQTLDAPASHPFRTPGRMPPAPARRASCVALRAAATAAPPLCADGFSPSVLVWAAIHEMCAHP